ncbi:MAG: nucleoside triphosphate pyrophosphohydrolase [Nitrospirota bacterium]
MEFETCLTAVGRLIKIMEKLRGPDGCPWDKEQTRDSLKPFLLEEVYEVLEALDEDDPKKIKEELGDMLFQIVFHCRLSEELRQFDMNDVVSAIADKMIKRHSHVFGDKKFETREDFLNHWREHKKSEGKERESILDGTPDALPALLKAQKLQNKATSVGFDWERIEDVFKKLDEEIEEFKCALNKKDKRKIEDEIGDVFFVLVRISNFVGVNPEDALRKTTGKFIKRFRYIEKKASEQGKKVSEMTLEEMDALWEEAKKLSSK